MISRAWSIDLAVGVTARALAGVDHVPAPVGVWDDAAVVVALRPSRLPFVRVPALAAARSCKQREADAPDGATGVSPATWSEPGQHASAAHMDSLCVGLRDTCVRKVFDGSCPATCIPAVPELKPVRPAAAPHGSLSLAPAPSIADFLQPVPWSSRCTFLATAAVRGPTSRPSDHTSMFPLARSGVYALTKPCSRTDCSRSASAAPQLTSRSRSPYHPLNVLWRG